MGNFQEGQEVELAAGYYRRRDNSIVTRGQRFKLTEEEANRSDADLIYNVVEDETLSPEDTEGDSDAASERGIDFSNPVYDNLFDLLGRANVKRAKEIVSDEKWDADGLRIALDAERNGKDRDSVVAYIEGRIADIEDEDEGFQSTDDDEE